MSVNIIANVNSFDRCGEKCIFQRKPINLGWYGKVFAIFECAITTRIGHDLK